MFTLTSNYSPAQKAEASFKAFRGAKEVQFFSTMLHKNGLFLYHEPVNLFNFYTKFSARVRNLRYPALVSVISKDFLFDGSKSGLSKRMEFFQYPTLNSFLNDAIELKENIEKENDERKILETDRKVRFFIIELNDTWIKELNEPTNKKLISELMLRAFSSRIILIFVTKKTADLEESFIKLFDWIVFLGANRKDAKSIFDSLEETFFDEERVITGTVYDRFQKELIPVHEIMSKKSSFKRANELIDEIEDATYKKLLESI
jgi:hypothetical protein